MQAQAVLHKRIEETCGPMHAARRTALEATVGAAVRGQQLTVTALGRAMESETFEKHNIKRADRLLSNNHLQGYREELYGLLAQRLVGTQKHPVILVDGSDLDEWRRHQLLRASLVVADRALTVHEEVHGRKTAVKPRTHGQFLKRLEALLPVDCQPVLVTDAGFKTPWFQAVEKLGWYWLARVRERRYCQRADDDPWLSVKSLHAQATATPRALGEVRLARGQAHSCQMVHYKGKAKGRHHINRYGERSRGQRSQKAARAAREPWVLATNLSATPHLARKVVRLYGKRMQIEASFRDMKSARFGLALEYHRSRDPQRLAILLLIAALALMVLWLIGTAARGRGLTRHYQANTVRHREVLSVIFLGIRIVERARECFTASELRLAWETIASLNTEAWGDEH